MSAHRTFPAFAAAILLLTTGPAAGQDAGLTAALASSGNPELPNPTGYGAEAWFGDTEWRVRVTWVRYGDDTLKPGRVCAAPGIGCTIETVDTSVRLTGLRLEMLRTLYHAGPLTVAAGGGGSFSQLVATATGSSGRRAALHLPHTGQLGLLGSTALTVRPLARVPLLLVTGLSGHWILWNGCVDPDDPTRGDAPFCGWDRITEVRAGITVSLPRR